MAKEIQLTTKQRILSEALTLFSIKGFKAVSVAEIAKAVGIKAPSLYKHYESKQGIFDAIIIEMNARFEKQAASMQLNAKEADKDSAFFSSITEGRLIEINKELFLYYLHHEYSCKFRKMLTVEQYASKELAAIYVNQYLDAPVAYHTVLFELLAKAGVMKPENPHIMALHFYAPMFHLLALCFCKPEREAEALQMVKKHIKQFNRLYMKKKHIAKIIGKKAR